VNAKKKAQRGQIFVLTPEEKKTILFVLCALVLGVVTKHYRDAHPHSPPSLSAKEQRATKKAARLNRVSPSPVPTTAAPE
jgi:CBS-domain-containing membrane protein